MVTTNGKTEKQTLYIQQDKKTFAQRESTAVKENNSEMFTTVTWGSGAKDNFFSPFLWFLCYHLRKKTF